MFGSLLDPFFLNPFPTFILTTTLKDTASPLFLFLTTAAYLFSVDSILFYSIPHFPLSQQFLLLVKIQGQQFREGGARFQ